MKKFKILILLLPFLLIGCNLFDFNKPAIQQNGLTADINSLVPQTTIDKMESLGMPINSGNTPPNIGIGSSGNIYKATPFILKGTNVVNDYAMGYQFADYYVKFSEQDNTKLTIKVDYSCGGETGTGVGGFVVGTGNTFTVFAKITATRSGTNADIIQVISGTFSSSAIQNLYYANFMLNDYGDPQNYWMAVGQGRVIYDSDGSSPLVSSFSAAPALKAAFQDSPSSVRLY